MTAQLLPPDRTGVRAINTELVLGLILAHGPLSRADLVDRSRLARTTVTGVVADLVADGLVLETGVAPSTGGRPRTLFEFNPDAAAVVGAQVADDEIELVTTNLAGIEKERQAVAGPADDPDEVARQLVDAIAEHTQRSTLRILGIGVGVRGRVDLAGRTIMLRWPESRSIEIGAAIEDRTKLPVTVANRAQVTALGSRMLRADGRAGTVVHLHLGDGVAAGIVAEGRMLGGDAGTVGHVTADPGGPLCVCGGRGCLTALVGRRQLIRRHGPHWRDEGLDDMIAQWVAAGVGPVVAALAPDLVTVGGPVADLGERLLRGIADHLVVNNPSAEPVPVAAVDPASGARGAALLWLERSGSLSVDRRSDNPVALHTDR